MSLDNSKTNESLGLKVEEMLKSKNLHTPTTDALYCTDDEKIADITWHVKEIWEKLGLDLKDDSLCETPKRIAKMMVQETMWGLLPENFPKITVIDNKMARNGQMVVERNVTVMSQCEHHGVIIEGKATVAYIPNEKVIGLSKINRLVEYFSKRPQVQERLTSQIAETLAYLLETEAVAVVIEAKHYCVASRGVEDNASTTVTSVVKGPFMECPHTRAELFAIMNRG